jgi:DUF1680 family protein
VAINGRDQAIDAVAGSYVSLGRTWRANDTIDIPDAVRVLSGFRSWTSRTFASIFYGPVLLAAEEAGPRTDWRR